jgi:outer membrane protein OmpA-like peptidoglycan-associated protein
MRPLLLVLALALSVAPAAAQQRQYLVEVGGAGTFTKFDSETNLDAGAGGAVRVGVWLPYRLSLEGEFGISSPSSSLGPGWRVSSFTVSLLGNLPIGGASSAYGRIGYGRSNYDSDLCPGPTVAGPCEGAGQLVGGAGFRAALAPTVMLRFEALAGRSTGRSALGREFTLLNFGGSAGVSVMLGSQALTDEDRDGIFDDDDDCPATPLGALVDERGCPTDADADKVPDGIDRCPSTPARAQVDGAGCPSDEDSDGVPDGVDRCPATPAGASVNTQGCPSDEDGDAVPDGLDRCPATPKDASVDQLGCPGDEDSDGVLDGLDRCPRTPPGTRVNAFGCPPGVERATGGTLLPGSRRQLSGVNFAAGSARLPQSALPALDSLASALAAQPTVAIEIAVHSDGTAAETLNLTQLRADAVRRYLISKGIALQRITAKGYGFSEPLVRDTSPASRIRNRRVEARVLQAPSR